MANIILIVLIIAAVSLAVIMDVRDKRKTKNTENIRDLLNRFDIYRNSVAGAEIAIGKSRMYSNTPSYIISIKNRFTNEEIKTLHQQGRLSESEMEIINDLL